MARTVIERLIDDIDGTQATQSVSFSVDGTPYQIDLNDSHAEQLRAALSPYVDAARRVHDQRGRGDVPRAAIDKDRTMRLRQWALDHGVELASRGRIAGAVKHAYDAGDVAALYAATGLELPEQPEQPAPRRSRRRAASAGSD